MVAFDAVGPAGGAGQVGAGVSSLTWTHILSASATDITIGFSTSTGTPTVTSVTVGAATASLVARADVNGSSGADGWAYKYRVASPPTGSQTVTVTMSSASDMQGSSLSYTGGGAIGTPVLAHNPTGTTTTTIQVTVATTSGSSIVDMNGAGGSPINASAGTGTARWVANQNANSAAGNGAGVTAPGTGSNVTPAIAFQGGGADFWSAVAVEIQAPGATTPPPPPAPAIPPGFQSPMAFPYISIPPPATTPPAMPGSAALSGTGTLSNTSVGLGVAMSGVGSISSIPPTITGLAGGGTGYFVDQFGKPRLVWGDAAWAWPGNAGRWNSGNWQADFDTFLSNRASQGFTVIYCKPIGTTQSSNIDDNGATFDGLYPFQGGSPSTGTAHAVPSSGLTAAFWARIDYMFNSALSKGITIFFNATGYSSDWENSTSWGGALNNTEAQAYGTALGNRYKNQLNLVWNIEDDYFGTVDTKLDSFLTGVRGAGDTHLVSIENLPESTSRFSLDSSPTTMAWGNSNGQYNFVYSYNQEYYGVERAYAESSPIPVIQGDGYFYQGASSYAGGSGAFAFDRAFRQAAWWALASAARGKIHGSESIWQYQSAALANSATDWFYAHNALNIRTLVESLVNWQLLLPDTASALVTGGRGTRASPFTSGGGGGQYEVSFSSSYVAASLTVAGDLALLYLPNSTTITIDQSKLVSGYAAWWVDPITGAMTSATTGSTYNSTAKGNNSQGDPDWALVFTAPSAIAGSASLSGAGTLTASPRFEASVSLSGSGTLTSAPKLAGSATLSGSGTLSAAPQFQASASLSGAGTLTTSFQLQDSASLSGTGTLTSSPALAGSASLSGLGTLTSSPQLPGSASLSGAGSLVLALGLQATLSGTGTLSASPRLESGAALSGLGTLTSAPAFAGSASLSGAGTLSASPQLAGSVSLSGSGTLTASPRFEASVALSGSGSLTLALGLQATFSGSGTLTAIAGGFPSGSVMSGTGTLSAVVQQLTSASLSGLGTLSAAQRFESGAVLSGFGTLTLAPRFTGSASLSGTGTLAAPGVLQGAVALSGSGTLTAAYSGSVTGSAALSGAGTLAAGYAVVVRATATLSGTGTLATVTVSVGILATVAAVDYPAWTVAASDRAAYTAKALDSAAYTTIATDFLP